ncbi:MAG: hypothetical protein HRT94_02770 [Alphaproteobacteria bacterium]|nr:hypothetical protein [Alphaproteobacteria bacterium]
MRFSLATIVVLGVMALPHTQAIAGFEFMAPKAPVKEQVPVQTPTISSVMSPSIVPPPAPVMNQPLAPAPVASAQQRLTINPYPMRVGERQYNMADVSSGSVNRAMVEESGLVTPMPLGPNMRTGAQPEMVRPASKPKQKMAYASSTEMVPMPGVSAAPVQRQALPTPAMYPDAVGFGKEIPLSIALMQIVPEGFETNLSSDDLENKIVSWEGGKPWNQVLNDVLRPLGYDASIQGKKVMISPYLSG